MDWPRAAVCASALALMAGFAGLKAGISGGAGVGLALQTQQQAGPASLVRSIGTVQAIQGRKITLKTDSGSELSVLVLDTAHMVRIAPGQKTLRAATTVQLQDLQVGDRILVGGETSEDAKSVLASSIIVVKRTDIEQKQQQEAMEWQRNGVGGLVKAVDDSTGTITITARGQTITVHTSLGTILRRYAPDSVRFQDAEPGTFDQIKPGDQLRARGTLSLEGAELSAAEIVSGSFRNIAGAVVAVDPGENEVTVMDQITKKPVVVKVTADSELRKLPETAAQRIAMQLKSGIAGALPATGSELKHRPAASPPGPRVSGAGAAGSPQGQTPGRQPNIDQILSGLPQLRVSDLEKGDTVMIVSTEGANSGSVTAIKLVSGVEPILTASPARKQAAMLQSLWNGFSTSGGGGAAGGGATP